MSKRAFAEIDNKHCSNRNTKSLRTESNTPSPSSDDEFPLSNYRQVGFIGDGTFGKVYEAIDIKSGTSVALKKVKMNGREGFPRTAIREIRIMNMCQHDNIVRIREVVWGPDNNYVFLAMDLYEFDLRKLVEKLNVRFSLPEIKYVMLQLLEGMNYLHKNNILHRDLKTENILMDTRGRLKICDFGLARSFNGDSESFTPVVVTLWYRSPELLLGPTPYSTGVDMWSIGCIFGELLRHAVVFPGNNEMDQLHKIFQVLGTPSERTWRGYHSLPGVAFLKFKEYPSRLEDWFPNTIVNKTGFDLLKKMLVMCPSHRISAEQALLHRFFFEEPQPAQFCDLSSKSPKYSPRMG